MAVRILFPVFAHHRCVRDAVCASDDEELEEQAPRNVEDMSLDFLSEIGGNVSIADPPPSPPAADDAGGVGPAGARAAVSSRGHAMLMRFLGSNNMAKPVSTAAEKQLVDELIAKHDALNRDPVMASQDILRDYTLELLKRCNDPACQLRKKVRYSSTHRMSADSKIPQSGGHISAYLLSVRRTLDRNAAIAPSCERARELEELRRGLRAPADVPEGTYRVLAPPPPPPAALPPAPAPAAPPRAPSAKPRRAALPGHGTNMTGRMCQRCHQHLGGDTGHKRPAGGGGAWFCPAEDGDYSAWRDAHKRQKTGSSGDSAGAR